MIRTLYFLILIYSCSSDFQDSIEVIEANKLSELKANGVLVVDIRTQQEYDQGHISGVEHVDFFRADFMEAMAQFDKNKPMIIHCAKGGRSEKAALKLKEAGFVKIYDYNGGFSDWKLRGLEIEK